MAAHLIWAHGFQVPMREKVAQIKYPAFIAHNHLQLSHVGAQDEGQAFESTIEWFIE